MSIKKNISTFLNNFRGWSSNRKIIVFESDDWGTIRSTNSKELGEIYSKYNINVNEYNLFDCLESDDDLTNLFQTLKEFKSSAHGQSPIFTANCIVRNPDFFKIEASEFKEFFTEDVRITLANNQGSSKVYELWKKGLEDKLFFPQLHGREHINFRIWLEQLQKIGLERELFGKKMWGAVSLSPNSFYYRNSMAGLNYQSEEELKSVLKSIEESTAYFHDLFGYYSKSYIANNYIWDPLAEQKLAQNNVEFMQGQPNQLFTSFWRKKTGRNMEKHHMGQRNQYGQIYLIRNCFFEPVLDKPNSLDSVEECLNEIRMAFLLGKPAIISTHRVNYIGGISLGNRDNGLKKLSILLKRIINLYPEVEFLSTPELGEIIKKHKDG